MAKTYPAGHVFTAAERQRLIEATFKVARRLRNFADDDLAVHMRARGLPEPRPEFRFHPVREWRFDWAYPDLKIAIEKHGIVWTRPKGEHRIGGRHVSARGFKEDIQKDAAAFELGWTVLRVLPNQVRTGQAADWLEARLQILGFFGRGRDRRGDGRSPFSL